MARDDATEASDDGFLVKLAADATGFELVKF